MIVSNWMINYKNLYILEMVGTHHFHPLKKLVVWASKMALVLGKNFRKTFMNVHGVVFQVDEIHMLSMRCGILQCFGENISEISCVGLKNDTSSVFAARG